MAQEPGDLAALDSTYPSQKEQTARDGSDERNQNNSAVPKTHRAPPRRRFDQRVMVNGSDRVFFEKDGFLQRAQGISMGDGALMVGVKNIVRRLGNDISEANPSVIPVCPMAVAQDFPGGGSVRLTAALSIAITSTCFPAEPNFSVVSRARCARRARYAKALQSRDGPSSERKGGRVARGVRKAYKISPELRNASRPWKNVNREEFPLAASRASSGRSLESAWRRNLPIRSPRTASRTIGPAEHCHNGMRGCFAHGIFFHPVRAAVPGVHHRSPFSDLGARSLHLDRERLHPPA
jgi:hypothetical protein